MNNELTLSYCLYFYSGAFELEEVFGKVAVANPFDMVKHASAPDQGIPFLLRSPYSSRTRQIFFADTIDTIEGQEQDHFKAIHRITYSLFLVGSYGMKLLLLRVEGVRSKG
jgi:hypothetical protein